MGLTFLIGGARSGKSSFAVELAERSGAPVTVIATAPRSDVTAEGQDAGRGVPTAGGQDAEMALRIERHRAQRPDHWATVEAPIDLAGAITRVDGTFTIVDCLTLWVSNLMWKGHGDDEIDRLSIDAAAIARGAGGPVVAVSNEVGMAVHPDTPLGRRYRDVLGRVNQRWAVAADATLLMVAGRALRLDDPFTRLTTSDGTAAKLTPR